MADLRECHNFLEALELMEEPKNLSLRPCWQTLNGKREKGRVKVAILDNGVDVTNRDLASTIATGRSFVRAATCSGPLLPWDVAADPHGTQMAYLIRMVNPWCRLYPARVASFHKDVNAKAAAEVWNQIEIAAMFQFTDDFHRLSNGRLTTMLISSLSAGLFGFSI